MLSFFQWYMNVWYTMYSNFLIYYYIIIKIIIMIYIDIIIMIYIIDFKYLKSLKLWYYVFKIW